MIVASFIAFQEPHAPTILRRRADKKRSDTGDQRYLTAAEKTSAEVSTTQIIGRSLSRPLRLLVFHPIVQILSIISALSYGLLYIALATFSELFVTAYNQSVEISGLHYIAVALGEISGSQIGGPLMDKIFRIPHPNHASRSIHRSCWAVDLRLGGAVSHALDRRRHGHVHHDFRLAGCGHADSGLHY
jgi:hypothetical protein